ncbi:MAG: hypothetical protein GDA56_26270 [Hormoscilla sp. GM7CHS1pb]|nr:hypothetical protein [Hormoscilla sp. GM7CHS1pb]
MDPLIAATVAYGTLVGTKFLEKTGEKVGEAVLDKCAKFLDSLKLESPDTVMAIEQAPEQPLDYGEAVLELYSAAKGNSEVAQTMEELAAAGKANPHPKFVEVIEKIEAALQSQQSKVEKTVKIEANEFHAEKAGVAAGNIENFNQNNTF